ncbi:MAG: peptidylprolyl isomerase [Clostridia bacterium]
MNKKLMTAASLVVSGMLALTGCNSSGGGIKSDGEKNNYDETVVATVDGQDITLADFNFAYYENAAQYQQYYQLYMGIEDWENQELEGKTCGELVRENALEEMKQLIVTQQKAKEYDVLIDDELVEQVKNQKNSVIENNFGGDEQYQQYLKEYFTSDYAIDKYLQRAAVLTNLFEKLSEDGGECAVSDDEVEYNDDKYIKANHVLIQISDDVTDEQALAKANEVVSKLNAGEDMAKLIEEYGEDPGMEDQDYYVFEEGEMVDEFYQGAKALKPGEFTQTPVKTSYGYHVIKRYPLENTDEKFTELKQSKAQEKFMDMLEGWVEKASVTVDDDAIDKALAAQKEELAKMQEEAKQTAADSDSYALPEENEDADVPEQDNTEE